MNCPSCNSPQRNIGIGSKPLWHCDNCEENSRLLVALANTSSWHDEDEKPELPQAITLYGGPGDHPWEHVDQGIWVRGDGNCGPISVFTGRVKTPGTGIGPSTKRFTDDGKAKFLGFGGFELFMPAGDWVVEFV